MSIPISSPELYAFYKWWLEEALSDSPDSLVAGGGLCYTVDLFADEDFTESCNDELTEQFCAAGLSICYPFGQSAYGHHSRHETMHLDPRRIAWVEARIEDYENQ